MQEAWHPALPDILEIHTWHDRTRSEAFARRDASVLPTSFLRDTGVRIRYRVVANLERDSERVVSLIRTLLPNRRRHQENIRE